MPFAAIRRAENLIYFGLATESGPMRRPGNPSAISRARLAAEAKTREGERCAKYLCFQGNRGCLWKGDIGALLLALGDPADFPNCLHPPDLGLGEFPLEYAIYWSPLSFVETLLDRGADPNYPDRGGFPSLIAALSTDRPDRLELLRLLLSRGAEVGQRGLNDWNSLCITPWPGTISRPSNC